MIILKRGKENMLPYYIFGSMEMCSREVEVGAFYLLGGLKHLIHSFNEENKFYNNLHVNLDIHRNRFFEHISYINHTNSTK